MKRNDHPIRAILPTILAALHTSEEDLHAQGIAATELAKIYLDFLNRLEELDQIAAYTSGQLLKADEVYTVRHRIKNPIHLLQKIVRKKAEYPDRTIDHRNYLEWINDLAGVRVLYLYREAWYGIARHIRQLWALKRPPVAYIGSNPGIETRALEEAGFDIRPHDQGYRALHFVIRVESRKQSYFLEIQLRTLFQEGWSEIDHTIRYPGHTCNPLVQDLLTTLNHLTANADEVASFLKSFFDSVQACQLQKPSPTWTPEEIAGITAQIESLPLSGEEKQRLQTHLQVMLYLGNSQK